MAAHTHDDVDWAARLSGMRRLDDLESTATAGVADRLTHRLGAGATVVDVGAGAGGMSAALAASLRARGGGTLVVIDAVDELIAAAGDAAREAGGTSVTVDRIVADAAAEPLAELVAPVDLVWASAVVHHLPDQQAAVDRLAAALRSGGVLAVAEGGLSMRCLPWDLGVGRPGLELRLLGHRDAWFEDMRSSMPDAVRMDYGWTTAVARAGLTDVTSFTYLVDHPAPGGEQVREFVLDHVGGLAEMTDDRMDDEDRDAVARLLDPAAAEYLGHRDDLCLLSARTVYLGRKP
ncbi:methyltransferase domain-containing protein [Prauserella halophila]|uniref:Methyltransferase domain-containing protein n=1 Tax=Prauserella halophila TaxID=185641 RepID=A0ABN1W0A0_9PSEU|nr:methyltransferase [Prauserella halophila]MCP2235370.1 Methyltransferase domain-containing protein [Prauserella halophila]